MVDKDPILERTHHEVTSAICHGGEHWVGIGLATKDCLECE